VLVQSVSASIRSFREFVCGPGFGRMIAAIDTHKLSPKIAAAVCQLAEVLLQDDSVKNVVLSAGLVDRVLQVMAAHATDARVQRFGCVFVGHVAGMFDNGELRRETVDQGFQLITTALGMHCADESVQAAGMAGYWGVSTSSFKGLLHTDPSCQIAIEMALSSFPHNVQLQCDGLNVLARRLNRDHCRQTFLEGGGVAVLINAVSLHSDSMCVVQPLCEILYGLADKRLLASVAPHVIAPLVTACRTFVTRKPVTANVLKFLSAVALESAAVDIIAAGKMWTVVVSAMQEARDDCTVQCFGWKVLNACLDHIPASRTDIVHIDSLKMVVSSLTTWMEDLNMQAAGCSAVLKLLTIDAALIGDFVSIHGVSVISSIMVTHSYDGELCVTCRSVLEKCKGR
jgi:hypothetical protein